MGSTIGKHTKDRNKTKLTSPSYVPFIPTDINLVSDNWPIDVPWEKYFFKDFENHMLLGYCSTGPKNNGRKSPTNTSKGIYTVWSLENTASRSLQGTHTRPCICIDRDWCGHGICFNVTHIYERTSDSHIHDPWIKVLCLILKLKMWGTGWCRCWATLNHTAQPWKIPERLHHLYLEWTEKFWPPSNSNFWFGVTHMPAQGCMESLEVTVYFRSSLDKIHCRFPVLRSKYTYKKKRYDFRSNSRMYSIGTRDWQYTSLVGRTATDVCRMFLIGTEDWYQKAIYLKNTLAKMHPAKHCPR